MTHLANQVAVVTGANSGIGKAITLALAAQGATVCLVGRRMEALQLVAQQASNGSASYQADLGLDSDITELVANLKQDVKGVDILVHSAGVIRLSSFECASPDQLDWHYKVNVRAPYLLTQGLLPMIRARQGQIVFVNSSAGLRAGAKASQYASTKHALKALADSLREEVNAAGIRVMSLFLGRTASPMQAMVHEMEHRKYSPELLIQPEDVAAVVINALTLPRTAEVTEVSMRPCMKSY
ncbi:MAG TPA: SDR family NAD(P)-dependent oxidoreductase [Candidatus Elarobacter sp.]|nr:MAG: short-chain dehydrogenase [Verrucomicrobiota bacterium]HYW97781.1 SDR family NAD(P)-dependent oxidoreductase [Candidatus Elarobacter sp.]